jgi:trigger factor
MNIRLEKKENCIATLSIEVPAETVTKERNQVIKAFMSQAKIPGFRPGKAPKAVIEKRHGEDISAEVENRLFQNSIQQALKENEEVEVLNVKNPQNVTHLADGTFSFDADLILSPEFELPEYKGLEIEIPKVDVTEEIIDQNLEQLQQRFADYQDIEDRALEDGDLAVIDFTGTVDGKPLDEVGGEQAKPLASNEGYWIRIEDEAFFPGFTDELVGCKVDNEKEIKITLPEDFPIEALRGQEAIFAVKVTGMKTETLPELNDEFAEKVDPGKTLEEVKELIREDLKMQQSRKVEEFKINAVLAKLHENIDFELPEEFIAAETQGQADSMVQEGMQSGMSEDDIAERQEELFAGAQERAKNNLKTNFLLQKIAAAEEIKVDNNAVLQRITAMAKQAKQPVKKYMKQIQNDGTLSNVRQNMLFSNAIDFLLEHASISEVEPKPEETEEN